MEPIISPFKTMLNQPGEERIYFDFEEDFVEQQMRCIPMIVRFKMDAAGIKLKLDEWSKFNWDERIQLALMPIWSDTNLVLYNQYLANLVTTYTGRIAASLKINTNPVWADCTKTPAVLNEKMALLNIEISAENWSSLKELERFALVKLCTSDHENKNLSKALIEFGLMQKTLDS
jgi:hypothetical protein